MREVVNKLKEMSYLVTISAAGSEESPGTCFRNTWPVSRDEVHRGEVHSFRSI